MSIALNNLNGGAYDFRGRAYYFLKDYISAVRDTTHAIELGIKNYSVFDCRGRAYFNLKQYENAINDFKLALWIKPNNQELYEFLKKVYIQEIHLLYGTKDRKKYFDYADWGFMVHCAKNLA